MSARSDPRRAATAAGLALAAWLAAVAPGAAAVDPEEPMAPDPAQVARGEILYRLHCASCHGGEARGHGPLADDLQVEVPDLTRLRYEEEGGFPQERIARSIDGRLDVASHGSREMPVWGLGLRDTGRDSDQENDVAAAIDALVAYLRTLQGDPAPPQ